MTVEPTLTSRGRASLLGFIAAFAPADRAGAAWAELVALGEVEELSDRLLAALHHRSTDLGLDAVTAERARRASLEVWSSNQRVVERARALASALALEGIAPVAIKGIALVGDHAASDRRVIGDIDMLLGVDELQSASGVLVSTGHPLDFEPGRLARSQRHAVIAPGPDGVWVDVHWRAGGGLPVWAARRQPSAPWPSARSVPAPHGHPLYASGWRVLAPHDSLAVLALHGCRPSNAGAVHLMADAHVLMTRAEGIDGERLVRALREIGHLRRGSRWLRSVAEHFGSPLPDELVRRVWRPSEAVAEKLEAVAARRTRAAGAGRVGLMVGLLAGCAAITVTRPWWFPVQVVDRLRWERASQHHTRIRPTEPAGW